jgi:hypothetical protein
LPARVPTRRPDERGTVRAADHCGDESQRPTFIDGEEKLSSTMEREANEFSEHVLVPQNRREELMDL